MANLPMARADELVVSEISDGTMVYDQRGHALHTLNLASAKVWRSCDGTRSVEAIAADAEVDLDVVNLALAQLAEQGLIDGYAKGAGISSRRKLLKKAGVVAIPVVVSVTVPLTAAHASCGPTLSDFGDPCEPAKNCCKSLFQCCVAAGWGPTPICFDSCP